ncbi:hypothetical protein NDU88_000668 [Pleurodeles waltl]|uniref:Uncharacterized protein n=1 Tax=Pleurodeles waltl TaxID=8319 RepID=A0AAV7URS0_PLEWA|nr:hypothetical protein NDU88_000668 [Pleurodeles waltl]
MRAGSLSVSVEEGELVDDGEEEDWWAQCGAGPANALSKSLQRYRKVQPAVEKAVDGAHIGRRKAQERPPSLTAGEESAGVRRVSVAVEASGDLGTGAARLVKGIYVSDVGVGSPVVGGVALGGDVVRWTGKRMNSRVPGGWWYGSRRSCCQVDRKKNEQ